jgi:hypothetical protein
MRQTFQSKRELLSLLAGLTKRGGFHAPKVAEIIMPLFNRVVQAADPGTIEANTSTIEFYGYGATVWCRIAGRQVQFKYEREFKKIQALVENRYVASFDNDTPHREIDSFIRAVRTA